MSIMYVSISEFSSSSLKLYVEYKKGSILRPIVHVLYIIDFPKVSINTKFILYADDSSIYFKKSDLR